MEWKPTNTTAATTTSLPIYRAVVIHNEFPTNDTDRVYYIDIDTTETLHTAYMCSMRRRQQVGERARTFALTRTRAFAEAIRSYEFYRYAGSESYGKPSESIERSLI